MAEKENSTQLAVIGAGPGGYPAAFLAADLGMQVTIIDPESNPGGVCLYRGCIPTKTLLHVAKVIREAEKAKTWGVEFSQPHIDLDKIRSWKDHVVHKLTGGLGQLCRQRKIRVIRGKARFYDPHTLEIQKVDGPSERLSFDHAVLATGSRPVSLPNIPIDSPRVLNSAAAIELQDIPKSLLVVGGGYIGLELGTVYATLGSDVSVVEMMPNILPGADQDLVRIYSQTAKRLFGSIMVRSRVADMKEHGDGIQVTIKGDRIEVEEKIYDKVLITVGRRPNSEDLGLEKTKVEVDDRGFVKVNAQRRTAEPSIYAVGDVVGGALLAHKATREGRVAVEVIAGRKIAFKPAAIPAILFTDPEITWCGITETEANEQNLEINIAKFPWGASGRAATLDRMDGLTKFIIDSESERILGVGIVGPGAGELISEGTLAMEMGAKVSDIAQTIHPHPTISETMMEAAEVFYGMSTHVYRPRKS